MYDICKNDNAIIKLIFAASGERQTYLDLLEIPGKMKRYLAKEDQVLANVLRRTGRGS